MKDLITFGQLQKQKKQLISTPSARSLIQTLPEAITLPDLTALWETKFRAIKEGTLSIDDMMEQMATTIRESIAQAGSVFRAGQWGEKACKGREKDGFQGWKGRREVPEVWGKDGLKGWEKRALLGLQQVSGM